MSRFAGLIYASRGRVGKMTGQRFALIKPARGPRMVAIRKGDPTRPADKMAAELKSIFIDHGDAVLTDDEIAQVVAAIRSGNMGAVSSLLPRLDDADYQATLDKYHDALGKVMAEAGGQTVAALGIESSFTLDNPYTADWLKSHTADLVSNITMDQRDAIKSLVTDAWTNGIPPADLADMVRPMISLTPDQNDAVSRFYEQQINDGASASDAASAAADYASDLLDYRSTVIARTETLAAENAGMRSAWADAQAKGFLSPDTQKVWIASKSERTCPYCSELDGQVVALGDAWHSDLLDTDTDGPPLHPQCRCTSGIYDPNNAVTTPADDGEGGDDDTE